MTEPGIFVKMCFVVCISLFFGAEYQVTPSLSNGLDIRFSFLKEILGVRVRFPAREVQTFSSQVISTTSLNVFVSQILVAGCKM